MKKEFDFTKTGRDKVVIDYLKSVYKTNISEDKFSKEFSELPRRKLKIGQQPGKHRSPSAGRYQYKMLKNNFNFFK